MIKASFGGGGKGMRISSGPEDFEENFKVAQLEAVRDFGDHTMYIEKYIQEPRHIEFQIVADKYGNVVQLGERDCSIQRHHQKMIEESPSVALDEELRRKMGEAAVAAAKAVNYKGAGTIEFLVDKHRNFYFLEMNTRLQVEHPITEEVVGVDLVKEQIRVANNEPLHFKQEDLKQRGHAIECRICAEDTDNNFMPSPGILRQLMEPNGIGVRIDSAVYEGYEIPIYYDPMIGKLIVWATTRQFAIERMRRVLYEYKITGLKTNISYLRHIMHVPDFVEGHYNTLFIPKHQDMLKEWAGKKEEETENIAMIAAYIDYLMNLEENKSASSDNRPISRWREFGKDGNKVQLTIDGTPYDVDIVMAENGSCSILHDGKSFNAELIRKEGGKSYTVNAHYQSYNIDIIDSQAKYLRMRKGADEKQQDKIVSPMPGKVVKIPVKAGDRLQAGDIVVVIEAMKMQSNYKVNSECVVKEILVNEGDSVNSNQVIMTLDVIKEED